MNYFGLFFSFTLPGIIIGIMIAVAVAHGVAAQRRAEKRRKMERARRDDQPERAHVENI